MAETVREKSLGGFLLFGVLMAARKGNGAGVGGPRMGAGWGGPAKGAHDGGPKAPLVEAGNTLAAGPHDMSNAERAAAHLARIERIAAEAEGRGEYNLAVMASDKALDRLIGKAMQTNINLNKSAPTEMTDADLLEIASKKVRDDTYIN